VSYIWQYTPLNGMLIGNGYDILGPSYGPFSSDFHEHFHEVYFHSMFWPSYFRSRVNPYTSF